ncbi:MAG: acyltransferase [Lachnospiraceae bacterium]|nr:acyltransferase [Lachnospiraceae bacterium]
MKCDASGKKWEITLLSVFLAMVVVFIHISSFSLSSVDKESLGYAFLFVPWRLSAFVVQGFIFLGGLKLFMSKTKDSLVSYYKKRFFKIFLPYLAAFLVFCVYFLWMGYFEFNAKELVKQFLLGNLVSHFYFIIIILQFYILRPLWEKIVSLNPFLVISVSLIITLISSQYAADIAAFFAPGFNFKYADRIFPTYLFFWICGAYAGLNYESFKRLIEKYKLYIALLFFALAAFDSYLALLRFRYNIFFSFLENLHTFYAILAILFFMLVFLRLSSVRLASCRFLSLLGASTFEIYLIHPLFIFIIRDFIIGARDLSPSEIYILTFVLAYFAVFAFGLFVGKLKELKKC